MVISSTQESKNDIYFTVMFSGLLLPRQPSTPPHELLALCPVELSGFHFEKSSLFTQCLVPQQLFFVSSLISRGGERWRDMFLM